VVKKKPLKRKIKMTKTITPEEDRREVKERQFQSLQRKIAQLNSYQSTSRIDLSLITTKHATGREYCGSMLDRVEQNNMYGDFEDVLLENRLFYKIVDEIARLRQLGMKPEALSIDSIFIGERTNSRREYAYMINFYGGRAK